MGRILTLTGLLVIVLLSMPICGRAGTEETISTLAEQTGVAVTIYNENLALVKDGRQLILPAGESILSFREVSGRLRPETAILRSVSLPDSLAVIEQNFDFDLLTPQKMIEKYVGKKVQIVRTNPATGVETVEEAVVLSANDGVVLRIGDRIETGVPGRMIFPDVPENLRDRPTLAMRLTSRVAGLQALELSYLTGGLAWRADYVAELNEADTEFDINGWVTLTNTSGTTYKNARVQLMAGDVNMVRPALGRRVYEEREQRMMAATAPGMTEESLADYHLYSLARPTTILENQTKQVALLQGADVTCKKEYTLSGQQYFYTGRQAGPEKKEKVDVFLEFANTQEANLGWSLPRGIVRVYKKDRQGNVQFVGEDRIDHTPENELVSLKLGQAFDVTAVRKQTDFKKLAGAAPHGSLFESEQQVELKNALAEAVTVKVIEPLPGDWEIVSENLPHKKESAAFAVWQVTVPAKGSAILTYRARVRL